MKKLAIIGASAALATLPVVGVFADPVTTGTDTISVTVSPTCTFVSEGEIKGTTSATLSAGEKNENMTGSKFTVNCNQTGGWYLKAKAGDANAQLKGSAGGTDKPIDTSTTLSGAKSAWTMKATATGTTSYQDNFDDWHTVPKADASIIKETGGANGATVQMTYGVYISGDQPADTYTGTVVYTLGTPASEAPGAD